MRAQAFGSVVKGMARELDASDSLAAAPLFGPLQNEELNERLRKGLKPALPIEWERREIEATLLWAREPGALRSAAPEPLMSLAKPNPLRLLRACAAAMGEDAKMPTEAISNLLALSREGLSAIPSMQMSQAHAALRSCDSAPVGYLMAQAMKVGGKRNAALSAPAKACMAFLMEPQVHETLLMLRLSLARGDIMEMAPREQMAWELARAVSDRQCAPASVPWAALQLMASAPAARESLREGWPQGLSYYLAKKESEKLDGDLPLSAPESAGLGVGASQARAPGRRAL